MVLLHLEHDPSSDGSSRSRRIHLTETRDCKSAQCQRKPHHFWMNNLDFPGQVKNNLDDEVYISCLCWNFKIKIVDLPGQVLLLPDSHNLIAGWKDQSSSVLEQSPCLAGVSCFNHICMFFNCFLLTYHNLSVFKSCFIMLYLPNWRHPEETTSWHRKHIFTIAPALTISKLICSAPLHHTAISNLSKAWAWRM